MIYILWVKKYAVVLEENIHLNKNNLLTSVLFLGILLLVWFVCNFMVLMKYFLDNCEHLKIYLRALFLHFLIHHHHLFLCHCPQPVRTFPLQTKYSSDSWQTFYFKINQILTLNESSAHISWVRFIWGVIVISR